MEIQENIFKSFTDIWDGIYDSAPAIIAALIVFAIFYLIGFFLRRLFKRRIMLRVKSSIVASFAGEGLFWLFTILGFLAASRILGFTGLAGSILAGAGISAIIFGFAFKDILENFLAGILLAFQKPFKVGDVIQVENFKGPVRALELRSTRMRLADGRDIWIPNAMIIKGVLTNYTRDGLFRHEFFVGIDTDNDVEKARNIILDFLETQTEVLNRPIPNVLLEEITGSGLTLKVLFWIDQKSSLNQIDPEARGDSIKSQIMRGVKNLLLENDFGLVTSYPLTHKMDQKSLSVDVNMPRSNA